MSIVESSIGRVRVVNKGPGSTVTASTDEVVIHADRTNPILGNRHYLANKMDPFARRRVIEAHQKDLEADLMASGPISAALEAIAARVAAGENVALACWCAPARCHAENYIQPILKMVERQRLAATTAAPKP
jgi:hypothetical protein